MSWLNALPLIGPLFQSGLDFFVNKQNIQAQKEINKQNIEATRENNIMARNWALEDYEKQNKYNSPLQQMQRYREAQLNPHLIYGNAASSTAAMVRGTQPQAPHSDAPRMAPITAPDLGGALSQIYDIEARQVDIDNKRAQTHLLEQSATMNDLKTVGLANKNAMSGYQLEATKRLFDTTIEHAILKKDLTAANVNKTDMQTKYIPLEFDLKRQQLRLSQARTKAEIERAMADTMLKIYQRSELLPAHKRRLDAEVDNMLRRGELMDIELMLRRQGVNPNDPAYMRILTTMAVKLAEKFGIDLGDIPLGAAGMVFGRPKGSSYPNHPIDAMRWK